MKSSPAPVMRRLYDALQKGRMIWPGLIMAVLYWLSSLPGTPRPADPRVYALFYWMPPTLQNVLHVPAYAALGASWCWALRGDERVRLHRALIAGTLALAYGIIDEWHQSVVPGRYASLADVLLDAGGIAIGIWLVVYVLRPSR